jgi:hypothetical protein
MRIEPVQHAADGRRDQLGVVRQVNMLGADDVEDLAEQFEPLRAPNLILPNLAMIELVSIA